MRMGIAFALCFLAGRAARAQGAGRAIDFPGSTSFEHINLGDSLSNKLDTTSFTLEMWINFDNVSNGDPAFIGNKDWNNGANTGFAWVLYNTTTLRFNFRPSGGTRRDYNITIPRMLNSWNHIAMVVNRKGNLTAYLNGLPAGTPVNIAADSARTLDGTLPLRLGSDGTGTYNYNNVSRFDGKIDEVRFWLGTHTQAQLRDNMCHKLAGTETGLLAYYPMNETSGNTINNNATAYATVFNGSFQNSPVRITSAAPVGDTSANLYPASFSGQSLALASVNHGNLSLQGFTANAMKGIHIYRTDAAPNTYNPIPNPNANNVYYGIYTADTALSPGAYSVQYDYTNFPDANTFEQGIDLFGRHSSDSAWASTAAAKNTVANTLSLSGMAGRRELIIGNFFIPTVCAPPTALNAQNVGTNGAALSWISGGSNRWNLEYSAGSFTPGTGTHISNLTTAAYALTGLTANTTYTFYVQDTCPSITSSSAWAGPFSFTTQKDFSAYAGGYAMNFPGTGANEHVNLGTALSGALDTTNFTMEMWINFTRFNDDEAFISNKNWNSGANTGFAWARSNKSGMPESSLWFNLQPVGGTRRDWHVSIPGLALKNNWNHVAAAIDRKGNVAFYINGIKANILQYYVGNSLQSTVSVNIASDSGRTINGTLPIRLGQDGTGTYGVKFNGRLDEVRIWKTVRTQGQIRDYMCRKLKGNEAGLLSYYRMDEPSGTTTTNSATATGSLYAGNMQNTPTRVISGAAIGDTSVYIYGAGLAGNTLQLGSVQNGMLIVDSLLGAYAGMQLYRVDTLPNTAFDIASIGNNKLYYGVFPVDTAMVSSSFASPDARYRLTYDYATYPAAVSSSANLHLYNRKAGDVLLWTDMGANNQVANNKLIIGMQRKRREVLLADFYALACANSTNLRADSITNNYARILWNSNGNKWQVQYGLQNFTLGQGTIDTVNTNPKDALTSLNGDTWYDVYVRNRCTNDSSKWVGPFSFKTTEQCPAPSFLQGVHLGGDSVRLSWSNTGAAVYNIQWGLQGFTFGTGIPVDNIAGTNYVLNGLSGTAVYEAYVQDTCAGGGKSKWFGPVTFVANGFTPPPTSVGTVNGQTNVFKIYPNPASDVLTIDFAGQSSKEVVILSLVNMQGAAIMGSARVTLPYRMDVSDLPAGIYILKCKSGEAQNSIRIVIRK